MRFLLPTGGLLAAVLSFAACGGQGSGTTGGAGGQASSSTATSTTSASTSSGGGAGGAAHGDCQTSADCNGQPCVPLTPGGYRVCLSFPMEATMCSMGGGSDPCCTSADCAAKNAGACYEASSLQFCGGAFPAFNECVADQCQADADCPPGGPPTICAPAGAFGHPKRACLPAYCKTDADCQAKPGGACLLVGNDPCCSHPAPDGLVCVYPGDCSKDADCPGGTCHLSFATAASACEPAGPGCPP